MSVQVAVSLAGAADRAAIQALLVYTESPFDVDRELARPYARLWVARVGSGHDAVGVVLAWLVADEIHVIDVMVAEALRRRGVAKALLLRLIAEGQSGGARLVVLEVRESNLPAIELYRAIGFDTVGERRNYYADGETALEMRLELRPPEP